MSTFINVKWRKAMCNVAAVILSAGKGKRMKSDISKQYMLFDNKPIIYYTIKAFIESRVDRIILVTGKEDIEYVRRDILSKYGFDDSVSLVEGGRERFDSSFNGVKAAEGSDYVLIHDGARPCIMPEDINDIIEHVKENGASVMGVPVKDTIKILNSANEVVDTPDRNTLWQIQTPQAFEWGIIYNAYNKMYEYGDKSITDDSMVVEKYSEKKVKIIAGKYSNIKVTTPEDIGLLEQFLKK